MSARSGDAELVIIFNAQEESFAIEDVVDSQGVLKASLNYDVDDLIGKNLKDILPEPIVESIDDYLEVHNGDCNITSILSRTRNFALVGKMGAVVSLVMRIQSDVSMDLNPRYRMVIRDNKRASGGLFDLLEKVSEYEVLDAELSISTKKFFEKKADIVLNHVIQNDAQATFALIKIDKFAGVIDVFGAGTGAGLLQEVIARCETSFRKADVVGYLGDGVFAVVLLETGTNSSRIPLNRLRSLVSTQPMFYGENHNIKATVSIAFAGADVTKRSDEMMKLCSDVLTGKDNETDLLIEI
jgi:diguanylate cyclase (GGDEF)-like protein